MFAAHPAVAALDYYSKVIEHVYEALNEQKTYAAVRENAIGTLWPNLFIYIKQM